MTVKIERIVPDGYGIGFADGLTVFVPLTAAGDLVKAKIDRQKGTIAFASVIEILEPSADRIVPSCPYFGRCGGCDFQQMNYEAQLAAKVEIVKDALRRIGKIEWPGKINIIRSPAEWNYRTRAQWKRDGDKLGYFERNSHRVIDIEVCPILAMPLQTQLEQERKNFKKTNFAEVQAVAGNNQISRRVGRRDATNFDENFYAANQEAVQPERKASIESENADEVSLTIGGFEYRFSAATFFQVNHSILPQFIETAIADAKGTLALDLYCGVGLFSLPLAKRFDQVIGIEGNTASIEFAQKNAANAGLQNATFESAVVGEWLRQNVEKKVDFVLLDPPRTGAERETIESLITMKPKQIVYASCNPATLGRDLRLLLENGDYQIEHITAFDFFPQTHHVETIVRLLKTVNNTKPCNSVSNSASDSTKLCKQEEPQ